MQEQPFSTERQIFILRLWRESPSQPSWLGEIEHVGSGKVVYIKSRQELLAYIEAQIKEQVDNPLPASGLK
ncbi:MAG: hypothetical protein JW726_04865 [Anaerolineales bacterium]|nr:hypothetical protein [Anaerolineales bacterium]